MLQKLKQLSLFEGLASASLVSLILFKASWPMVALVAIMASIKITKMVLDSKKAVDNTQDLKDRISSIENKISLMSVRR